MALQPATRVILSTALGSLVAAASLVVIARGVSVAKAAPLDWVDEPAESLSAMMANQRVLSYPFEQVWPTAIRYLRVDRGYEITDRDQEAGYVLFEFTIEAGRRGNGSLEMFRTEDSSGRPSVSVSVSTGAGPVHLPNAILEGLATKVREERGQPSPPPPKEQPKDPEPPKDDEEPPDDGSVPLLPPARDPG